MPRRVRPRRYKMHIAHGTEASIAEVRHDLLLHGFSEHGNLLQNPRTLRVDLWLDDVEAAFFKQPTKFLQRQDSAPRRPPDSPT